MYFFGLGLYIQRLDQIIVWSFSWLFITLSLLDAVVNHPYQYLLSYFDTFLTWWSLFFDYFVLVNWHHLLLCKQDKQHTVTLACSMFIIHVPFVSNFPHFRAEISSYSLCISWGRAPTCLEFPRRLPLSRCRAGEWPDDKFMYILGALFSLNCCIDGIPTSGNQYRSSIFLPVQHGSLSCCWGRISYSIPFSNANLTNEMGRLE